MKFLILLIILNVFHHLSIAQIQGQALIDSLLAELPMAKEDTNKVNLLYSLCDNYETISDYDKGLQYGKEGIALAHKLYFRKGEAKCYNLNGIISWQQGNYDTALENYFAALKIREEIGDITGVGNCYNNIGLIYESQGNDDKALENYLASLKISKASGNKKGIADSYNNIAIIYKDKGNYDEALKNHIVSLKTYEELSLTREIAYSYNNIGMVYMLKGEYDKALKNLSASLKPMFESGDKQGVAVSYISIGDVYLKLNNLKEAKHQFLQSVSLAKSIGSKDALKLAYQSLSKCDSAAGNWMSAYQYHKLFKDYNDSIFNAENIKSTAEMSAKYESGKKESQIKLLEKEKEKQAAVSHAEIQKQKLIRQGVTGGLAGAFLFSLVVYRQRNRISKEKTRSDELLLNILPFEVAEELKETGTAKAKYFNHVSVLFTDFINFTQVSEKLSAEDLVKEINYCYSEFDKIITQFDIEKIKTIGDSYMCAGGLPTTNETHPWDLVNAALLLQEFIIQHKEERIKINEPYFELRVGIHTGAVIAGIVGIKKFAYDIWGDTVNIASRMESSGEAGKVNISGATYELVKDKFHCTHRGKIQAKNKGEIDMYFVNGKIEG